MTVSEQEKEVTTSEHGMIRIADEVVAIIAGMAATEVEGVSAMSGGFAGDIAEVLGRRSLAKGVKVEVGTEEAKVDLHIVVRYGKRIPDVAWEIQDNVKKAVEQMTGLKVLQVNVHVQGVSFPGKEKEEETEGDQELS